MDDFTSNRTGQQMNDALKQMNDRIPEQWAVGQIDGVDVPPTNPRYHNNAKYYAENAQQSASDVLNLTVDAESLPAGSDPTVDKTGGGEEPYNLHFGIPNGADASISVVEYQVSESGTTTPTGTWSESIPIVPQGQYLWTRYTWNDGTYTYQVNRQPIDGDGAGDMLKADYDSDSAVQTVGGIKAFVNSGLATKQDIISDLAAIRSGAAGNIKYDTSQSLTAAQKETAQKNISVIGIQHNAGFHNSIYRSKDITAYFQDGTLWSRINGTNGFALFEDLYLGDYFDMGTKVTAQETDQGTTYGNIGSQWVTIAGFDTMMGNGSASAVSFHHLVMVPGQGAGGTQHFGRHRMNPTNTTVGGYVGSEMFTNVLGPVVSVGKSYAEGGTINEQLYKIFGSHLKTTNELLSNSLNASGYNRFGANSGCSNNWAWTNVQSVLMSEIEAYGSIVWSSSGYDTGTAKAQLPLFALCENAINNRSAYYWLKDVAAASSFALVGNAGRASFGNASAADDFVRPRFLIS